MVKTDYQNGDILSARDINDYGTEINAKANKTYVDTELAKKANINDLSEVATSGSYNDLTNKPYIPTKTSDLTNDSGFITQHQDISGKENLSNKVIAVDENSTDIQYPSAKCLYDLIQQIKAEIKLEDHPLYSLYWSLDPTMNEDEANTPSSEKHPHTLFGGTWERIKDRFILAAGNKFGIKSYPQPEPGVLDFIGFGPFKIGDTWVSDRRHGTEYDSETQCWKNTQMVDYELDEQSYDRVSVQLYPYMGILQFVAGDSIIPERCTVPINSDITLYFSNGSAYTVTPNMVEHNTENDKYFMNLSKLAGIGGEDIHYQSVDEMPKHNHISEPLWKGTSSASKGHYTINDAPVEYKGQFQIGTEYTGNSQPSNNMPPYITAYCWMRVPDPISI